MPPNKILLSVFTLIPTQSTITESESTKAALWSACSRRDPERLSGLPKVTELASAIKSYQDPRNPWLTAANLVHKCTSPLVFVVLATFTASPGMSVWTVIGGERQHILARSSESQNSRPGRKEVMWRNGTARAGTGQRYASERPLWSSWGPQDLQGGSSATSSFLHICPSLQLFYPYKWKFSRNSQLLGHLVSSPRKEGKRTSLQSTTANQKSLL